MKYSFHDGIPDGFIVDFDSGIFHDQQQLHLQSPQGWHSFSLLDKENKTIHALIHYHLDESVARSPYRSPFSSFVFSKKISAELLYEFVVFTEDRLKVINVKSVWLKNPPEIYDPAQIELLQNVLVKSGYDVTEEEVSAVIPIGAQPFEVLLHRSEKKRLRRCREVGLTFKFLTVDKLSDVYNFLNACRKEKGYSLSMRLDEIKKAADTFPEKWFLSVVLDKNQFVAANISVSVNSTVLYNFYHDHKKSYDAFSPVVLLNEGLYQFCQQQKLGLLDLGTSSMDGILNTSLLNFKLRLGAKPSRKLTFIKKLS